MSYESTLNPVQIARLRLTSYLNKLQYTTHLVSSTLSTIETTTTNLTTLFLTPPKSGHEDLLMLGAMQCVIFYTGIMWSVERCVEELEDKLKQFMAKSVALTADTEELEQLYQQWMSNGSVHGTMDELREMVKRMNSGTKKGKKLAKQVKEFARSLEEAVEYLTMPQVFEEF